MKSIHQKSFKQQLKEYRKNPLSFVLCISVYLAAAITIGLLGWLVIYILIKGLPYLSKELFTLHYTSDNVSMMPAIIHTVIIMLIALLFTIPFGIGAAIYLVEYARKGDKLVKLIRLTSETLAGIPSIIYGLFGSLFFVTFLDMGYSLLAGALTLAIMVLPVMMRTTEEALLCVPDTYREGSFGLGAGKLRTVMRIVLPVAMPGILSGIILSVGRIVGETAALIYTAGTVTDIATSIFSSGRTLSVHMYSLSKEGLHTNEAYATAVVLLCIVALTNGISSFIERRFSRR